MIGAPEIEEAIRAAKGVGDHRTEEHHVFPVTAPATAAAVFVIVSVPWVITMRFSLTEGSFGQ